MIDWICKNKMVKTTHLITPLPMKTAAPSIDWVLRTKQEIFHLAYQSKVTKSKTREGASIKNMNLIIFNLERNKHGQ